MVHNATNKNETNAVRHNAMESTHTIALTPTNTTTLNFILKNGELAGRVTGSAGNRLDLVGRGSQCKFFQPKRDLPL